jgi:hypothetical protein
MGILDAYFSPQTYGGDLGGILGRIPEWMLTARQSQGLPPMGAPAPAQLPATSAPAIGTTSPPSMIAPLPGQPQGSGEALGPSLGGGMAGSPSPFGALASLFSPSGAPANAAAPAASATLGTPAAGTPAAPAAASTGPDLLARLTAGAANLTTGGNPLAGIMNAIGGLATGARTDRQGLAQQAMAATFQSLVRAGVDPATAQAAALNPEILKTIAAAHFDTKPQFTQIGEDMFGNKQYGFVQPNQLKVTPAGGGGTGGAGQGAGGYLAPGVTQVDQGKSGDDYLAQFSPEVQAAVKAYVGGESMPTGNPRKGFTQAVKMIAQKYGQDIGLPADDTTFAARRQMRNQLSSGGPSSLGGQINVGNTALGHLADLSRKALDLGNVDVGIAPLSHAINAARGLTSDQSAKLEALKAAAQHYGQEVTKFYAGSPGGVAERDRFMEAISGAKTPQELAAVIATEAELMHSRLTSLESQIKGTLGPMADKYPAVRPESQKALEMIDANVSRLKGGAPTPSAQSTPLPKPDAEGWIVLPNGVRIREKK